MRALNEKAPRRRFIYTIYPMLLERFILLKLSKSFSMCMLVTAVLIGRLIVHRISVRHHTHRTQSGVVEEATLWQCVAEFDPHNLTQGSQSEPVHFP